MGIKKKTLNKTYIAQLTHPPSSLMDLTTNPKLKTTEGERVGACFVAHNTSKVEGHVGVSGWD
jgi:hypothetical protein